MSKFRFWLAAILFAAVLSVSLALLFWWRKEEHWVRLPGGSIFSLREIVYTSTNHNYAYETRGPMWDRVAPILPASILAKIPSNAGSFGFGSDGETNLIIITALRHGGRAKQDLVARLRVSDGTNRYDACWGAHTLGLRGTIVNGWKIRAFPRRARDLTLEFLAFGDAPGEWRTAAEFRIPNPAFGVFPDWSPGELLATNDNLTVRLARFRSGAPMEPWRRNLQTVARTTEMLFDFAEDGQATDRWRVQKVTIADATGNRWYPYLDQERLAWAQSGKVEFFGALWPGEKAWKLEVEAVQTKDFPASDLFSVETDLPAAGTVKALNRVWQHRGVTVEFVGLASPNTDHAGDLKWTGKYWGEKGQVYSLVATLGPERNGCRLQLLSAEDQAGNRVELVDHGGADHLQQAFFLRPEKDVERLKLVFSFSPGRTVIFSARPEFE